ncbi:NAD(P)H-binding protein [Streptomyces sp. G-G2]|uniref:NmrA family NAD(P)-binding protein n=1 Tax=Streptomyces sp. G-G2 TaxID=3046201 RepID=UPI0024B934D7|nr:NAD(P)H-binding protein [Streptomyces sp. G-G2]MDJ0379694.1 NAD(P)H-binding protein [Streptomyces sp. G-G2]
MTILVTGGRGAVARGLAALLVERGIPFRPASREPAAPGAAPGSVHCDLTDPATFPAALKGVRSVFLYAAAEGIDDFVKEAVTAGVQHIALLSSSSVLGPDARESALSASHLAVEEALLAAPLRTTLLRPGSFASNAGSWAWPIRSGAPVRLPYPGSHSDPVHETDIAEAAFAVLTDAGLGGRAYTLTGPRSLSFEAQIEILAGVLGRPIACETITPAAWKSSVADYIPEPYADALLAYWAASDGVPVEITDTVELLTGHPARSFATWAEEHVAEFAAPQA